MNVKTRLKKLEQAINPKKIYKWMCVTREGKSDYPKGYYIQPFSRDQGGDPGAKAFYLKTRADLEAFGAQPDADLLIIDIVYV